MTEKKLELLKIGYVPHSTDLEHPADRRRLAAWAVSNEIKLNERFRQNRLKCKDCEREEPISKIIRNVRSRIFSAIKNKSKHTIIYLGCNCSDYLKWLLKNKNSYTFENYGKEWHIDHVIPISKFDITNEEQQLLAFNWRNTMTLSVEENLKKNKKIIK